MKTTSVLVAFLTLAFLQVARSQGFSWIQATGPIAAYDVRSFTVNSHGTVFAGTWTDGSIWKTTDNGGSWSKCGAIPNPNPVLSLCVNPGDHIFASVYLNGMFRSTDGGASWQVKNSGLTNLGVRTSLIDNINFVWVATEGGLFRSTDDGESWTAKITGTFYNMFVDSTHAIVADDGSFIYRSSDHGDSWALTSHVGTIALGGIGADGSYFASNGSSGIFRSVNWGGTWNDMHSGVSWSGFTDAFMTTPRGDVYYARDGYSTGILVSRDTGQSWTLINTGLTSTRVNPLFRAPNGFVYAGTNGAGVFRSSSSDTVRAPILLVQPGTLDFGFVKIGLRDTLSVQIANGGNFDTLKIGSITSPSLRFTVSPSSMVIPPRVKQTLVVVYAPTAGARDTATLQISSNDPVTHVYSLSVAGQGYGQSHSPFINRIVLMPSSYSQAQISWFRTVDDTAGAADPATQYSIWQRSMVPAAQETHSPVKGLLAPSSVDGAWEFVLTVPAIRLDEYAAVVPIPYIPSTMPPWYVFIVVAQTKNLQVYTSPPDSIQDPSGTTGIDRESSGDVPGELTLRQNFPNPFNPSTIIQFGLAERANVSLVVYNALGQIVATLIDQQDEEAGFHEARFDGSGLASGAYFCRLKAGPYVRTSRLLLVR